MIEIPTEIVKAAASLPPFPKFSKGGFIPLKPQPNAEQNCDEKDFIEPPELFVRIRDDEECNMGKLSDVSTSESIPTDWIRTLQMHRSC